jgi:hypothetical protein
MTACTCPSGDGSLRWPCPSHPPMTTPHRTGNANPEAPEMSANPMSAPTPLVTLLDQLDELRAKATTPGWSLVGGTPKRTVINGRGLHVCETFLSSDAALIVGAVNALPELIAELRKRDAAVRAVLELIDELDRLGSDRDRDNESDDEAQAASAAAYLRSASLIRTTLAPVTP